MIKLIALLIFIYSLLGAIALKAIYNNQAAISCLFAGMIMIVNLVGLFFIWRIVFYKKSIALAVLVIIFKYLILGWLLWFLSESEWIHSIGFVVGFSTLLLAILSATLINSFVKTMQIRNLTKK